MMNTAAVAWALFSRAVRREDGQDLIEYALLVALIALAAAGAVLQVGETINGTFWSYIANATGGGSPGTNGPGN
jgi:Flp pilus assembly pilin Flp